MIFHRFFSNEKHVSDFPCIVLPTDQLDHIEGGDSVAAQFAYLSSNHPDNKVSSGGSFLVEINIASDGLTRRIRIRIFICLIFMGIVQASEIFFQQYFQENPRANFLLAFKSNACLRMPDFGSLCW